MTRMGSGMEEEKKTETAADTDGIEEHLVDNSLTVIDNRTG